MPSAEFPKLLKHCTVAVYGNLKVPDPKDRFQQAFAIARAQLSKYGYLTTDSATGPVENIRLTAQGMKREANHSRERGGWNKTVEFDKMYRWIETEDPPLQVAPKGVGKPLKKTRVKGQLMKQANRKLPFK
jgi:hypothetical protein